MASQKYWQETTKKIDDDGDISLGSEDTDEGCLTQEQAEEIFREECRLWIKNNSDQLGVGWQNAYKKPWTKKSSSKDWLSPTNSEKILKKENK